MKYLLSLTILLVSLVAYAPSSVQAQDWKLERDKKGVKVYTKPVKDSKLKAYKGITTINASVEEIIKEIRDGAGMTKWVYKCKEARVVKDGTSQQTMYALIKAPWPVSDRDNCMTLTYNKQADGGYRIEINNAPDAAPKKKGIVRIPAMSGYWLLTPNGDGTTQVEQKVHSDPGGSIPDWVTNAFVVDAPYETLLGLKRIVESKN